MPFRILTIAVALLSIAVPGVAAVDFLAEVQPVFASKCVGCHSGASPQAGLSLHTRADLLKGGMSGAAVLPGDAASSLMVAKIEGRQGMRMPPSGPPLDAETIRTIRAWIDEGAKFEGSVLASERVAPLAPRRPELPAGQAAHPVDRFVEDYFAKRGIAAAGPVSDAVFARRAWLDLTGLPPTPEELRTFSDDAAPGKRAALVERLLANRDAYAGHWMSFWNDLLRNDEGVIYHGERKSITQWLYRALETNKPYDAMVRELLSPEKGWGAEGYLVGVTWRGVVSASQTPPMQASQNSAQVFLGMNLKCAACHDSFVNRWKLADTYGLAAMFSDDALELTRCDVKTGQMAVAKFPIEGIDVSFDDRLESRRDAAARWFTDRENGRFARTIVNRYWQRLFGRALVEPVDDMDAEPWHEDLLDWLAWDFAENGYDLQRLLHTLMTSRAYQLPSVSEDAPAKDYTFGGPQLRRLTAEQFQDAISSVSGAWRVNSPRTETHARYTREWRLKSDPLSRALGRPIRDQVYTERNDEASMLQALELTNGPLMAERIRDAAASLLGVEKAAPQNIFDSKMVRSGPVEIDVDITGAKELWLVLEDVDSYDPARVIAGWANAELLKGKKGKKLGKHSLKVMQKTGTVKAIAAKLPSMMRFEIPAKGYTRFRAQAVIDERSRQSDISPALRFFVFTEKPDPERLIRIEGEPLSRLPRRDWSSAELAGRLYLHLLARAPAEAERRIAISMLGEEKPTAAGVEDLLWAILMSPEFQYIH